MKEKSLIIVKPDGVMRGLIGEIIARLERKGLKIVGAKLATVSKETAEKHYAEHKGKSFYDGLIRFITRSPVMLLAVEGNCAIASVRNLVGKTNGVEAAPGTIRGDFGSSKSFNLIHASDGPEAAQRELALFFRADEIASYELPEAELIFGAAE